MASMIGVWSVNMNKYFHNHRQRYLEWYNNIVVGEANIMPEGYFYQPHILDSVANYNTHCIVGPDLQFRTSLERHWFPHGTVILALLTCVIPNNDL